jgi:glycosyltransferase involved in cell wall biosynthesis
MLMRKRIKTIASVIIPAHNEETVIANCIESLLHEAPKNALEIIVVCNGCKDKTSKIAKSFGDKVKVIDTSVSSKSIALNLGNKKAKIFPRFFLDADIELSYKAIRDTVRTLRKSEAHLASLKPTFDLQNRNWKIQSFYKIWELNPYFDGGKVGGAYALSKKGIERINHFPMITADDEYVRRCFLPKERITVKKHSFIIQTPYSLKMLFNTKRRSHRGNYELNQKHKNLKQYKLGALLRFAFRIAIRPWRWKYVPVYIGVTTMAKIQGFFDYHTGNLKRWEKDLTSRRIKQAV